MSRDIRSIDWSKIRHFRKEEFDCKCGCGACNINDQLVFALDLAREKSGTPFNISSGARCEAHNKKVGFLLLRFPQTPARCPSAGGSSHR